MAEQKQYKWYKIAESKEEILVSDNGMVETEANGKNICIVKTKDELKACVSKCPHAGGKMVDGFIDALGNIVCPLHRYKFSLQNGRNVSGEGYYLKTFPIEVREDGIYVGFEEKTGFWSS